MLQQKLQNRQPNALQGLGVILGVAAAVLAGSAFFSQMASRLGTLSSLLFIAYGCAIAWFLLYWYVMSFIYTAAGDCLRLCRAYGKRERFIADIRLGDVAAYGSLEEVKTRFPDARVTYATRAQCEFEPLALARKQGGSVEIFVIQPDDKLRDFLIEGIRENRK